MKLRIVAVPVAALTVLPALGLVAASAAETTEATNQVCSVVGTDLETFRNGHLDIALSDDGADAHLHADDRGQDYASKRALLLVSGDPLSTPFGEGWVLPQTQEPDLPWPGFNSTGFSHDTEIRLTDVEGPGDVLLFLEKLGDAEVVLDSSSPSMVHVLKHTHQHTGWFFSEAGAYLVTFEFDTGGVTSEYTLGFAVGDDAVDLAESCTNGTADSDVIADLNEFDSRVRSMDSALQRMVKALDKLLAHNKSSETTDKSNKENKPQTSGTGSQRTSTASGNTAPGNSGGSAPSQGGHRNQGNQGSQGSHGIHQQAGGSSSGVSAPPPPRPPAAPVAPAVAGQGAAPGAAPSAAPVPAAAPAPIADAPQPASANRSVQAASAERHELITRDLIAGMGFGAGIMALIGSALFYSAARKLMPTES